MKADEGMTPMNTGGISELINNGALFVANHSGGKGFAGDADLPLTMSCDPLSTLALVLWFLAAVILIGGWNS